MLLLVHIVYRAISVAAGVQVIVYEARMFGLFDVSFLSMAQFVSRLEEIPHDPPVVEGRDKIGMRP